jgi:hypothetical protein
VSLPCEPASALKHGVSATYDSGRSFSSSIWPRNKFVRGTSAVGIRKESSPPTCSYKEHSGSYKASSAAYKERRMLHNGVSV